MGTDIEKSEYLTKELIHHFLNYLMEKGCSKSSLDTYRRVLIMLDDYIPDSKELTSRTAVQWCEWMNEKGYSQRTINHRLSVLNSLLEYLGHRDWQSKNLPVVDDIQPELTRAEYLRLLSAARRLGKKRTYLLIKTLGGAGIRLQELPQLTMEAVTQGTVRLESFNQGTIRLLHLPRLLQRQLLEYCQENGVLSGPIFLSRTGRMMNRTAIQNCISRLAGAARVDEEKANPRCLWRMYLSTQQGIENDLRLMVEQTYDRMLEAEELTVGWDA